MRLEVPRQGTWICGSSSKGVALGYVKSGLQPTRAIHARLAKRDLSGTGYPRVERDFSIGLEPKSPVNRLSQIRRLKDGGSISFFTG